MKRFLYLIIGLFALSLTVSGCDQSNASAPQQAQRRLTIFAAASTTNVIEQLAMMYQQQTGVKVMTSFASSSTLARQIEQGAKADLYLSANTKWMDYLQDRNLIATQTRLDLLANRIVLIAPTSASLQTWQNLEPLNHLKDKLAMGDPDHVPAGMYGKTSLTNLGFWDKIVSQVVPAKDVRGALLLVETGQASLGLVYATDAAASKKVSVVYALPQSSHKPVRYPLALTNATSNEAAAFAVYLQSDEARSVFEHAGFEVIR
ncbi:MAG: molybdate ABC transporter substrate-binding protein [Phycisphaeraceae bacterium JB051]